ncbi:MAG TPA: hypothetical protein VHE36_14025 [Sphingomicrobium sp.]|jgi:hypothetical protein|nr:hypothetical protein [Sphingomicrobium sp.]
MRTDQSKRFSVVKGMALALLVSLAIWLVIALLLRGHTPIW